MVRFRATSAQGSKCVALVPKVRVELTRGYPHRFLRPARLPFRHFGRVGKMQLIFHRCGHFVVESPFKNTIVLTTIKAPGFQTGGDALVIERTKIDVSLGAYK